MKPRDVGEEKKVSRYSLTPDENNNVFLSENSYLHNKPD
jgi:hypothetical protein